MASTTYTADELGKLNNPQLEELLGDAVPTEGSGKDGNVVKSDLVAAVLARQEASAPPADDQPPAPPPTDEVSGSGNRRKIQRITERGDWLDPFSGLMVHHSAEVCLPSGARRDGDFAVIEKG